MNNFGTSKEQIVRHMVDIVKNENWKFHDLFTKNSLEINKHEKELARIRYLANPTNENHYEYWYRFHRVKDLTKHVESHKDIQLRYNSI